VNIGDARVREPGVLGSGFPPVAHQLILGGLCRSLDLQVMCDENGGLDIMHHQMLLRRDSLSFTRRYWSPTGFSRLLREPTLFFKWMNMFWTKQSHSRYNTISFLLVDLLFPFCRHQLHISMHTVNHVIPSPSTNFLSPHPEVRSANACE
jgi:hypothetical protein